MTVFWQNEQLSFGWLVGLAGSGYRGENTASPVTENMLFQNTIRAHFNTHNGFYFFIVQYYNYICTNAVNKKKMKFRLQEEMFAGA